MAVKISNENFSQEVLNSELPVLADFYSDSCIPCKMLSPVLSQIEADYKERIKVVKININFNDELIKKYQVQSAPTLVFFINGEEIERFHGVVNFPIPRLNKTYERKLQI
ncbi:MAG: thioredoxin family protein [Ruminococcus sp.]|nr:thioredoxin family protein [Ruminococcus sp.]